MMKNLRKSLRVLTISALSALGLLLALMTPAAFWQITQAQQSDADKITLLKQREIRPGKGASPDAPSVITPMTYPFSTATGVALEDMSMGTTQLLGANQDDTPSAVTAIGFSFNFDGTVYTDFSANSNGLMRLGTMGVSGAAFNFLESTSNNPKVTAYWDDLCTGATGRVHFKVVGSAPNRKLVVEFQNMVLYNGSCSAADPVGTYQVWLNEGTNRIDFVYGAIAANMIMGDYSTGIASSPTSLASVDTDTNTATYGAPGIDDNTAAIAAGRQYSFTPPVLSGPGTLSFSSATYDEAESFAATITVSRLVGTTGAVTVNYATSNGTATSGACGTPGVDYAAASGTLTFADTEATKTFTVQLCGDILLETSETVTLTLSNPTGGATLGTPNPATLTITDAATQFANPAVVTINDNGPAAPYPSTITVAGAPAAIGRIRVSLFNVTHTYLDDVDVLLVGPGGQTFVLTEDAGGFNPGVVNADYTFSDNAATIFPNSTIPASGAYEPANYVTPVTSFALPAPPAPYNEPGATLHRALQLGGTTLNGVFGGTNPNGMWQLFVRDDAVGDIGQIGGGWGLEFVAPTAASVTVGGRVLTATGRGIGNARLTLTNAAGASRTVQSNAFGYYRFSEVAAGGTYVLNVRAKRFDFPNSTLVLSVTEDLEGVNFTASP